MGRSVGIFLFKYLLFAHGTEIVKKNQKISDLEKKKLSSSKTGESVGNAKQTIFYLWPKVNIVLIKHMSHNMRKCPFR